MPKKMTEIESIMNNEIYRLSSLIDKGQYKDAYRDTLEFLQIIEVADSLHNKLRFTIIFHIAGLLIDIGSRQPNKKATRIGLDYLLKKEKENIISALDSKGAYYYTLSNGESNLLGELTYQDINFKNIEDFVKLKSGFWKAIKYSTDQQDSFIPEYRVNLGISLMRQFRIVEALQVFDDVNLLKRDIPQAWYNRSNSLQYLEDISGHCSLQLLEQIQKGYEVASKSETIPPQWVEIYKGLCDSHSKHLEQSYEERGESKDDREKDLDQSKKEHSEHSEYRKFCNKHYLTLSEHGLYCSCLGSARDELSVIGQKTFGGNEVIAMEMVLNRVKSEFSLSRRFYYEYHKNKEPEKLFYEDCYTELYNSELLGIDVEKLRTSFRLCFGILDKIAVATCELYNIFPSVKTKNVNFHNTLWRLDQGDRREKFDSIKNPGLLALYSIASDLNTNKDGEWAFFKEYRNNLEHSFVVIHESDDPSDMYDSHQFLDKGNFIKESDFIQNLEQLLQLTRSAIFSFVFMVRGKNSEEEANLDIAETKESIGHRFFYKQDYHFVKKDY